MSVPNSTSPPAPASTRSAAGSAESQEGGGSYRERTVRYGDTSFEGMGEKIRHVIATMERRMAAFGADWTHTTGTQIYTVFDIHPHLAQAIVAPGGARHGVDWHYCRPPVIGLDYEMDCRAVFDERVIS